MVENSPRAVAVSAYVIRAFVKMREEVAANAAILRRLAEIDKTLLVHDVTLREILQKLRPLLEPPPLPPKPEIGFHVKEDAVRYRVPKKNWMEHVPGLGTSSFRRAPRRLATSDRSNWSQRSRNGQPRGEIPTGSVDSEDTGRTDTGTKSWALYSEELEYNCVTLFLCLFPNRTSVADLAVVLEDNREVCESESM